MFDFQVLIHYYNPTMPDIPPERRLGDLLKPLGLTLVTAESCTGGLIGHLLTSVSGSSDYYLGGAVTYSNEMKEGLLGVRKTTMIEHGAVSEQTALEMAAGARARFGGDIGVSVTGIAGPGGGSEEKPVGLTYIGLSAPWGDSVRRFVWDSDREGNKRLSAEAALEWIIEELAKNKD
jgi:PncC family amidohydrolase